MLNLEREKK